MIAVTGATGFVGRALCRRLAGEGRACRGLARAAGPDVVGVGDIGPETDWRRALAGVDSVVHLAARVHQRREGGADVLSAYRHTNVAGTLALARQARAAGVRRLVFVSSIKVNGERTRPGRPFRPDDPPAPQDPYAVSKHEAERALGVVAAETGLEIVVVRPPLVYGAGVGANFRSLVSAVRRGVPLPLAAVRNKRSLIAVDNLADLLLRCVDDPRAAGEVFLCSDGADVSTPDLLRAVAAAEGCRLRLIPVPVWGLRTLGQLLGQGGAVARLTESLQVDAGALQRRLGWRPPFGLHDVLRQAAANGWRTPPLSPSAADRIE